ncbi:hypothetical protein GUJ93_ZPchr0008g12840 [Zizania palustris]|uniref:RRM domain-containing protein n=1 Tax=Zizania palustris TaxID=103762 RepID=A0A8J5RVX9_ZIZPA|nr:hypothetical protein GUJ93_ZPchr0008g12840 [Zizania palustris]
MAVSASYHALLHLPSPIHSRYHLPSSPSLHRCLRLAPSSAARAPSRTARFRTGRSARSGPLAYETEEREERPGWSYAEEQSDYDEDKQDEEEQGWAGGNAAARGESDEEDAGDDLTGRRLRPRPRPRELFVSNLPRRCDVDDLFELFRPYGAVLSVEISRDAETGISRGCGFATMRSLAEARTAMNVLDGFVLDGREMLVKLASDVVSNRRNISMSHTPPVKDHIFESPHKIYVGNIAWSVQPQDLREYFSQCGTVVSTRLLTDRKGGRGRAYGFLSFSSAQELDAALLLDSTHFHGRNILVREAHEDRRSR